MTTPRRPSKPVSGGNIVPPTARISGSAARRRSSSLKKRIAAARSWYRAPGRPIRKVKRLFVLDAGGLRQHGLETAQRQARADEQQRRQRHFRDDEAESQPALQAHRTAAAFLQRLRGILAHEVPRRQHAGEQAAERRTRPR